MTIAVLLDYLNFFSGGYEAQLRDALHARCQQEDHHLLLLYGGAIDPPHVTAAADNTLFDLVQPGSADGLIVVSSLLSAYCGSEGVERLIERYRPAKLCSLGIELPGVPSIVLENGPGMEAAVEHLVRDHGCRHLVFLGGTPANPESTARFNAYRTVLDRHGIPYDPSLVAAGYFRTTTAKTAMEEILSRGLAIDGVVAANDEMAAGAIDVLRKHGRRVPQDISVTGFDDLMLARLGNPPLTTVAQPFDTVAELALKLIVDQVAGREVAPCTRVPGEFVRRQSCGCGYEAYRRDSDALTLAHSVRAEAIGERIHMLGSTLASILHTGASDGAEGAFRLADGLCAEAGGRKGAFREAIGHLLEDAGDDNERHRALHNAISCLRDELYDYPDRSIERCLFDGLSLVALSNTTTQVQHRLLLDENYLRLLSVGEHASVAFDLSSLRDALVKGLPNAGVRTAFLSCATDGASLELEPTVCLSDGVLLDVGPARFPASHFVPPGVLTAARRETFLVLPLAFESQFLGIIAFNYSEGTNAYTAFRNEIVTALRSIRLRQELVQKTLLHERSVQERMATTKRLEALSVLAGGVAHDLNNALGPLVALPDLILSQLGELPVEIAELADLRADVESIKAASLRAAQTIKDLLTLGRQGRTVKEALDLNSVVKGCLAESSRRFAHEGAAAVNMIADLTPFPLLIKGSDSHLTRAVGNLIRNAIEAVARAGEVVVKTAEVHLTAPTAGYETIPPGRYVVLSVSDDGCGIAPQELGRVFEPFFTKKRAGESSGSGLGLAIVHGVVKEHDGFIDVASTPGVGTTFTLYLPLVMADAEGRELARNLPCGDARILIVDDEPIQLRTCRRVLVRLGYQVEILDSGIRAYEMFCQAAASGKSPFDLVIMDMVLNEVLDGLQIFERIQRLFPAQKAIVVSGHATPERIQFAINKGLIWLSKPYAVESLAQAVQRALQGDQKDGPPDAK